MLTTTNGPFGITSIVSSPSAPSAASLITAVSTISAVPPPILSYAQLQNARFKNSNSNIESVDVRFTSTLKKLPTVVQTAISQNLSIIATSFRRRNPQYKTFADVQAELAKGIEVPMTQVQIDTTMQRLLNINWVMTLLSKFSPTKVMPIQVYRPDPTKSEYLAWDGQHTLVLLWIIATQIFGEDPNNVKIPVNIYSSNLKSAMRESFVVLNSSEGQKMLDQFDLYEQMIYGVRIDRSTNPYWIEAEKKQTIIENHNLFITSKKFGDDAHPGAISRTQEVMKLPPSAIEWLCEYLVHAGATLRPVEEKEMVMMAYFFDSCRLADIDVTSTMIKEIASVSNQHWNCNFSPTSQFWVKAQLAYENWHSAHVSNGVVPRFFKEPRHGYPFLIEQLKKDLPQYRYPSVRAGSEFVPAVQDLF